MDRIEEVVSAIRTITREIEEIKVSVEDIKEGIKLVILDRRQTWVDIARAIRETTGNTTRLQTQRDNYYNIGTRIEITNSTFLDNKFSCVKGERNGIVFFYFKVKKRLM